MKNYSYWADKANLAYYRDYNAKEIDVIVEENGQVHPLEFKKSAMARPQRDQKNQVLDRTALVRGSRGIICMCGEVMPIYQKNSFIPCILYRKESSW